MDTPKEMNVFTYFECSVAGLVCQYMEMPDDLGGLVRLYQIHELVHNIYV